MPVYRATTRGLTVLAVPEYLEHESDSARFRYAFAYTIQIENHGDVSVTLRNRHWEITNARGEVEEVNGPGVVGEQPTLNPGEAFRYTSGAMLATDSGIMVGAYEMEDMNGETFWIDIPAFSLDAPNRLAQVH